MINSDLFHCLSQKEHVKEISSLNFYRVLLRLPALFCYVFNKTHHHGCKLAAYCVASGI